MVEMTSHSHTHVSYADKTLAFQTNDLKDGNDEMELVTGGMTGVLRSFVVLMLLTAYLLQESAPRPSSPP